MGEKKRYPFEWNGLLDTLIKKTYWEIAIKLQTKKFQMSILFLISSDRPLVHNVFIGIPKPSWSNRKIPFGSAVHGKNEVAKS